MAIGRAATWLMKGKTGKAGLIAAGGLGVMGGLLDRDGPWRSDIFPRAQDAIAGDPNALQNVGAAAIASTITGNDREDVLRPGSYYYGEPFNPTARSRQRSANPVPGDIVFGMYNLRR